MVTKAFLFRLFASGVYFGCIFLALVFFAGFFR